MARNCTVNLEEQARWTRGVELALQMPFGSLTTLNLDTNIKQKTAELKEGAMAMRQVTTEAKKADRQIAKNVKAGRAQSTVNKFLAKERKAEAVAIKKSARETAAATRATERDAKAKFRSARASARLREREASLMSGIKKRQTTLREQQRANSFGGRVRAKGDAFAPVGAGLVIAAGITAGVAGIREATAASMEFSDTMTGLLSLGNNAQNFDKINAQVQDLSITSGKSVKEIAGAMFTLQSATSNLSQSIRDDLLKESIELSKANGTELEPTLNALTTTYQIYGKEVKNVADLQNKLQLTQQRGKLTFQDLATFLPDVASAAQAMGFSLNEVNAALTVATVKGGRTDKTFTGLRNVFLRLEEAQKKGITLTGSFADKIEQLQKVDKLKLLDIFGAESIAVINNLVKGAGQFNIELEKTRDIRGDIAAQTLAARLNNDPFFAASEDARRKEQVSEALKRDPKAVSKSATLEIVSTAIKSSLANLIVDDFDKRNLIPGFFQFDQLRKLGTEEGAFGEFKKAGNLLETSRDKDRLAFGNAALESAGLADDRQAIRELSGQQGGVSPQIANLIDKLQKGVSESARAFDKGFQKRQQDSDVRK